MGVTTIQFSPHNPHSVAVGRYSEVFFLKSTYSIGSYDEQVRIFDTRKMVNPLLSVSVGGGVWRVKHHPQSPSLLLTANMHNGHSVLEIRPSESARPFF
jgi:diphthamide biosynthesis protein 7